jgi:hypothetical protein
VSYPLCVQRRERIEDAAGDGMGLFARQSATARKVFGEGNARDMLVRRVNAALNFPHFQRAGQTGMVDRGCQAIHREEPLQAAAIARRLPAQHTQAIRHLPSFPEVGECQPSFAQLPKVNERAEAFTRRDFSLGGQADQLQNLHLTGDITASRKQRIAQRLDRLVLGAMSRQRASKGSFGPRTADVFWLEAEDVAAQLQQLIELEQPLELRPQDIGLLHGPRGTGASCPDSLRA